MQPKVRVATAVNADDGRRADQIIGVFGDAGKARPPATRTPQPYCSIAYKLDSSRRDAHNLLLPSIAAPTDPVSTVSDNFVPYAHAERELCDIVGPLLADVIKEVEQRNSIKIREIRVTIDPSTSETMRSGANCVIVR